MKYLKLFENFSNEIERATSQLADLDALRDFAVLSADEYRQQSKDLYAMIAKYNRDIIKKINRTHKMYSDDWFQEISQVPSLSWLGEVKDLPEYSELLNLGLRPVSSIVQLGNRTLVFSRDPNYKSGSDYAIGFFSSINIVRRMTKDIVRGSRLVPVLDQKMKSYDGGLSPLEFFQQGMAWVLENIDFSTENFANKRTVKAAQKIAQDREYYLREINNALSQRGISFGSDLLKLPLIGLNTNLSDLRTLFRIIKAAVNIEGPLRIPINPYYRYKQSDIDLMSRYPEVEWTLAKDQFMCNANDTRNWNIRFKGPVMRSVSLEGSVESARDILAKLQRDGIRSLEFLIYPSDDINLTDYQLSVEHPHIVGQPYNLR